MHYNVDKHRAGIRKSEKMAILSDKLTAFASAAGSAAADIKNLPTRHLDGRMRLQVSTHKHKMTQQQWTLDDVRATFRQCQSLFHALGDPARQEIILLLSANERLNVSQITEQMHLSRPAISHHLKVLKDAGLVALERESRENFYRLLWDEPVGRLKLLIEQAEIACG